MKTWRKSPASNAWAAVFKNAFWKRWLFLKIFFLPLLLREVPSSSLNIERLKDRNAGLCRLTHVKMYVKMTFLLMLNLTTEAVVQRCSLKKGVLRNFTKFTGRYLCQSLFFSKVADLSPESCNFIKKETLAQVFSCEFCEISKTKWLLL